MTPVAPPVTLSIAGSDCSAGAGIQADLKTFTAFDTYGLTAVTCVVAEVPGRVTEIAPVSPSVVGEQIRILTHPDHGFPIAAAKTGMLYSRIHIRATMEALPESIPLVVDPVMVASSGDPLLLDDAVAAYWSEVFPRAAVITPNLDEATFLLGRTINAEADLEPAARELCERAGSPVLLKGGHLKGESAIDILVESPDAKAHIFTAPFVPDVSTHGTGCTYSAAITACLASGETLPQAVDRAKKFVTSAIAGTHRWRDGDLQALDHRKQSTDA